MSSKGLELPINVIVIVAIAVLVLVVAAALFSSQFGAGVSTINLETAYQRACNNLRTAHNCDRSIYTTTAIISGEVTGITNQQGKNGPTLQQICLLKFRDAPPGEVQDLCYSICGCPKPL